jgi:hypothetical protein
VDPRLAIAALVIACRGHWGVANNLGKIRRRVHLEQALVSALSGKFAPAGSAITPTRLEEVGEELRGLVLPAKRAILDSAGLQPVPAWERAHGPIENAARHLGMGTFEAQWVLRHVPEQAPILPNYAQPWIRDHFNVSKVDHPVQRADPELVDPAAALAAQRMGNPFAVQLAREYALLKRRIPGSQVNMINQWVASERFHSRALSYAAWYSSVHGTRVPTLLFMAGVLAGPNSLWGQFLATTAPEFFAGATALLAKDPTAVVDAIRNTLLTWFHYSPETWTRRPHVAWNPPDWATAYKVHIGPRGAA